MELREGATEPGQVRQSNRGRAKATYLLRTQYWNKNEGEQHVFSLFPQGENTLFLPTFS